MSSTFALLSFLLFSISLADLQLDLSSQRKSGVAVVRQLNAYEKETLISRDTIKSMETASRSKRSTVNLRQITDGSTLLQLFYKDSVLLGCEIENHPSVVKQLLERFNFGEDQQNDVLEESQYEEMTDWAGMEKECKHLQLEKGDDVLEQNMEMEKKGRSRRSIIFPGTTWCGVGNASKSNDLVEGVHGEVDRCCREHDFCPYTIDGFTRKYNMFNFRFHTISHCECDERFRTCLKMINSEQSNEMGRVYFNLLSMKCFIFKRETICAERNWYGKCTKQKVQVTAEIRDATSYNLTDEDN